MLFTLVITHLFALAATNPFHKYPYVFLLDVGNEELQKTNSEQIRVSIPGGSLALRYPGVGDGATISHVRVSGIDFGTNLKVNIVDGGPGSNYAVIVFMGNPGAAYDAVVTIQTVSDDTTGFNTQDIDLTNDIADNTKEVSEEENNSAEESDNSESDGSKQSNTELTQASSNYYNYANNEIDVSDDSENDGAEESDDNNDELEEQHSQITNAENNNDYNGDEIQEQNSQVSNQDVEVTDYDENNDDLNVETDDKEDNIQEEYNVKNGYEANEYYNREESAGVVGNLYYDRLNIVRPYLYNGARIYQDQAQYNDENNLKSSYDADVESDQGYGNDDIHEVSKDSNNNFYDSDDSSPVES